MQALTVRFPEALIEEWAPVLFVALAARLVNDSSAACRSMYISAAQALLQVELRSSARCDIELCWPFGSRSVGQCRSLFGLCRVVKAATLGARPASYTESMPLRSCDCFCTMTGSVQLPAVASHCVAAKSKLSSGWDSAGEHTHFSFHIST